MDAMKFYIGYQKKRKNNNKIKRRLTRERVRGRRDLSFHLLVWVVRQHLPLCLHSCQRAIISWNQSALLSVLYSYACGCCLLFLHSYAVFGMSTRIFASGKYSSPYCWLAGWSHWQRLELHSLPSFIPFPLSSSPPTSQSSIIRKAVKSLYVAYFYKAIKKFKHFLFKEIYIRKMLFVYLLIYLFIHLVREMVVGPIENMDKHGAHWKHGQTWGPTPPCLSLGV